VICPSNSTFLFSELTAALSETLEQISIDAPHVKAHRRASGGEGGLLFCTKGGRNTKVHAISDEYCRPLAFYLTPGQVHDIKGAVMLGAALPKVRYLLADKAYDADHWRGYLKSRRIQPVIPNKSKRK